LYCYQVDLSQPLSGLNSANYPKADVNITLPLAAPNAPFDLASDDNGVYCYVFTTPNGRAYCGCYWVDLGRNIPLNGCLNIPGVFEARVIVGGQHACFFIAFQDANVTHVNYLCLSKVSWLMSYSYPGSTANGVPQSTVSPSFQVAMNDAGPVICHTLALSNSTTGNCVNINSNDALNFSLSLTTPVANTIATSFKSPWILILYDASNVSYLLHRVNASNLASNYVSGVDYGFQESPLSTLVAEITPDNKHMCSTLSTSSDSGVICIDIWTLMVSHSKILVGLSATTSSIALSSDSTSYCAALTLPTGYRSKYCSHVQGNLEIRDFGLDQPNTVQFRVKSANGGSGFIEELLSLNNIFANQSVVTLFNSSNAAVLNTAFFSALPVEISSVLLTEDTVFPRPLYVPVALYSLVLLSFVALL